MRGRSKSKEAAGEDPLPIDRIFRDAVEQEVEDAVEKEVEVDASSRTRKARAAIEALKEPLLLLQLRRLQQRQQRSSKRPDSDCKRNFRSMKVEEVE